MGAYASFFIPKKDHMAFNEDELNQAKSKAMVNLMSRPDSAFFATLAFSMQFLWDESIPTACTNGTYIKFNPNFFMDLSPDERVFVIIHESCHVAYLHASRLMGRSHERFNIAADHVINLSLIERGYKMPKIGLANPAYTGMSTEQVYDLLVDPPKGSYQMDLEPSEETEEEISKVVDDILCRAAMQSKIEGDKVGTIPGEIEIYLSKLLKPKLPWQRIFQKYFQALAKDNYTFKKFNRRFLPNYYLPTLYSEKVINFATAFDTSGSVTDEEFLRFVSEVHGVLRMMKPDLLTLIQFDTAIHSVEKIKNVTDLMKVSFKGRGGTDVTEVLEWANANKPQLLLIFTDGHFNLGTATTKVNTIWLIHNNSKFTAPFGKVIHYTP